MLSRTRGLFFPMRLALFADSAPQFLERALLAEANRRAFPLEVRSWAFASPLAGALAALTMVKSSCFFSRLARATLMRMGSPSW